jgi:uncharacterized protein YjcR
LFIGTQDDNIADMVQKQRQGTGRGSQSGQARLTEEQVIEIRRLCAERVPFKEIAERFNVTIYNVASIKRRRSWAHIP